MIETESNVEYHRCNDCITSDVPVENTKNIFQ